MKIRVVLLLVLVVFVGGGALARLALKSDATSLHVLDVGQGDAILVRHGSADILVDGGPDSAVLRRLGEVRPFWDRRIEVVVLTHPQQDHLRGLLDVIEREKVGLVLLPRIPAESQTFQRFIALLRERNIPVRAAFAGQRLTAGDLSLRVLAPDAELLRRAKTNANIGSIVLRGNAPSFSFLLTGDIEAPTEQYLVQHAGSALDVDVLKVPHHGSKTSSTPQFLRAVSPFVSLMSVGEGNRYGHPHKAVLERYPANAFFRTDEEGTVSLHERASTLFLHCADACDH